MGGTLAGGASRPVTEHELVEYGAMQALQARQRVPLLQPKNDPNAHVFAALFDGTGQDLGDPKQLPTNVGHLARQLQSLSEDPGRRVRFTYVEGIGTQSNPIGRAWDGAVAHSWDEKIEKAYVQMARDVARWKQANPEAEVRVMSVGYSRGAVLAPGFARLVDRYGIADPDGLTFGRDEHGNITVESPRPPLIAPGQVAQTLALMDPVGTNLPRNYDARPPASVLATFSLLAGDENRELFPHLAIADLELSADRRHLGAVVAGGHSNVGGGNREAGLETLAFNAMADFLNAQVERPLVAYRAPPAERAQYTVFQADGATAVFGLRVDRDGQRNVREELANCVIVNPCRDAEPVDAALASRFAWRPVTPGWTVPTLDQLRAPGLTAALPPEHPSAGTLRHAAAPSPADPSHPDHAMLEQIRHGVRGLDAQAGKPFDEASERLSRHLLAASKDGRDLYPDRGGAPLDAVALRRVDHVVVGTDGRFAFAVEGRLDDPAHRRAAVLLADALKTPLERADARLDDANRALAQELGRAPTQVQAEERVREPVHAAPVR
ncbi:T6SS phospholipase effector Tle1-like catalytic domain-containing protein [Cognatilysobacter tabacisoli]|uniref:T6SS phospholipase effector Tle1-like catalytic domain-containing protein n=1 Tax=Cognatilysobacter tabacisoli TaxID=2315424 RepID=UPI000E6B25EB|nr:DUF2235 domain-containing protein [Lysobacter tabacisoli]